MSFQDLELGIASTSEIGGTRNERNPSRALVAGVFRINTAVAGYKRSVNRLGTPRDTAHLRRELQKTKLQIRQLIKETSAELNRIRTADEYSTQAVANRGVADCKLIKDYESVLKEFEKTQLLEAERIKTLAPITNRISQSSTVRELEIGSLNIEQESLLQESNRQVSHWENQITLNEAIIEEREEGIREVQQQIGEVNEIFKDLAHLVREQGAFIDDISSNIESSGVSTAQATSELERASKTQRATSSMKCLMLVMLGIILLIVVFVVIT